MENKRLCQMAHHYFMALFYGTDRLQCVFGASAVILWGLMENLNVQNEFEEENSTTKMTQNPKWSPKLKNSSIFFFKCYKCLI